MKRYCTPEAIKVRDKLGPFDYGVMPGHLGKRETRPEILIDNGARYIGEWIVNSNTREGKGISIPSDGSIFEGWFNHNIPNGKGRSIYASGVYYEG